MVLDAKVLESTIDQRIVRITEPAAWPATPTLKVKGIEWLDPSGYQRASGELTFAPPIAPTATVEVFDGATLVWQWTGAQGDIVGS